MNPVIAQPPKGTIPYQRSIATRQWLEVYDLCHTFLHVALDRKHTDMRELHVSFNVQKRATKSDTSETFKIFPSHKHLQVLPH